MSSHHRVLTQRREQQEQQGGRNAEAFLDRRLVRRNSQLVTGGVESGAFNGSGPLRLSPDSGGAAQCIGQAAHEQGSTACQLSAGTLPDAAASHLEIRAHVVRQLSGLTKAWLSMDDYAMPVAIDVLPASMQKATGWRYYAAVAYNFLAEPTTSTWAMTWSLLMILVIVLSTIAFILSTLTSLSEQSIRAYDDIETACVIIFTFDYVSRWILCPMPKWRFMIQPFNIIDLISILPWYISLALQQDNINTTSVFRVLRLLRIFRLLKVSPRLSGITVVVDTLARSTDILLLMAFFVALLLVLISTVMYLLERGNWDEALGYYVRPQEYIFLTDAQGNSVPQPSPFSNVPMGFWWTIVPVTPGGKAVAMVVMLCGILTLALPIGVLGTTFTSLWLEHKDRQAKPTLPLPPLLKALDDTLTQHVASVEDIVKTYSLVEQEIDGLRSKLHDKVVAWRKTVMTAPDLQPMVTRKISTISAVHPGTRDSYALEAETDLPIEVTSRSHSVRIIRETLRHIQAQQRAQGSETSERSHNQLISSRPDSSVTVNSYRNSSLRPESASMPPALRPSSDGLLQGHVPSGPVSEAYELQGHASCGPIGQASSGLICHVLSGPVSEAHELQGHALSGPVGEVQQGLQGYGSSGPLGEAHERCVSFKGAIGGPGDCGGCNLHDKGSYSQDPDDPDSELFRRLQDMLGDGQEKSAKDRALEVILELADELQAKTQHLQELFMATALVRSDGFLEKAQELRSIYEDIQTTQQEAQEQQGLIEQAEDELTQLHLALADLVSKMHAATTTQPPTNPPHKPPKHPSTSSKIVPVLDPEPHAHTETLASRAVSWVGLGDMRPSGVKRHASRTSAASSHATRGGSHVTFGSKVQSVFPESRQSSRRVTSARPGTELLDLARELSQAQDKDGAAAALAAALRATRQQSARIHSLSNGPAPRWSSPGTQQAAAKAETPILKEPSDARVHAEPSESRIQDQPSVLLPKQSKASSDGEF